MSAQTDYYQKMLPIAVELKSQTGISIIVTITQSAHESNWGLSGLTKQANNLFGFTGESWAAAGKPVIKLPTAEYINKQWVKVERPFRAYSSWAESVADWARLMQQPRYVAALAAAKNADLPTFATEVAKAGYATDPKYAPQLIAVGQVVHQLMAPPSMPTLHVI